MGEQGERKKREKKRKNQVGVSETREEEELRGRGGRRGQGEKKKSGGVQKIKWLKVVKKAFRIGDVSICCLCLRVSQRERL